MAARTSALDQGARKEHLQNASSMESLMATTPDPKSDPQPSSNTEKPADNWVTGDEPMTGAQASYLKTLCEEAGEAFDPELTKAEASKRIDSLRSKSDRVGSSAQS